MISTSILEVFFCRFPHPFARLEQKQRTSRRSTRSLPSPTIRVIALNRLTAVNESATARTEFTYYGLGRRVQITERAGKVGAIAVLVNRSGLSAHGDRGNLVHRAGKMQVVTSGTLASQLVELVIGGVGKIAIGLVARSVADRFIAVDLLVRYNGARLQVYTSFYVQALCTS